MHRKLFIGLALAALITTLTARAQSTNQVRSLSLKECVDMALAHNLNIQIERYSPQIASYRLRAAYGAFDPSLDLSASRSFTDQPAQFNEKKYFPPPNPLDPLGTVPTALLLDNNGVLKTFRVNSEYELTVDSVGSGLSGRLPEGLSYNLFARSDYLDARTFPSVVDLALLQAGHVSPSLALPLQTNDYYATVGIKLKQPLLKDFWIDRARETIQLNKKNVKISELALRDQLMRTITTVTTAYYDLVFAREQIQVEKAAMDLAVGLLEFTRRKVEAGTLTMLDQQRADSEVETIRTALFAAEQVYAQQANVLKSLLADNYQPWIDVSILPTDALTPVLDLPSNRAVSWVNALNQRPDILQMRLALEKQDIILRFTYNQLFPSLDLIGSYGWQAVDHRFTGSWSDIGDGGNPFYSVGVVFSIPLGNITARNDYKASKLAKQQSWLQFKKLEQDVITEVDTAVKLAETNFKQITSTHKAAKFAEDAFKSAQKEYEAGTRTSEFVLEFQDRLTKARSAEIRALADYHIALAKLALSEGTTLEKNQIKFK